MSSIVNYIWIGGKKNLSQRIPSPSFYFLQENSKRYPDAQFNLWVEDPRVCKDYVIPSNVTVCDLASVENYSRIPALSEKVTIWDRVDIARLMVLRHVLKTGRENDRVIYSDFDVADISLDSPLLQERLEKYDAAFAGTYSSKTGQPLSRFENGYMAFGQQGLALLDHIIDQVVTNVRPIKSNLCTMKSSVYHDMGKALDDWAAQSANAEKPFPTDWPDCVGSFYVLPSCGKQLDPHLAAEIKPNSSLPAHVEAYMRRLGLHAIRSIR